MRRPGPDRASTTAAPALTLAVALAGACAGEVGGADGRPPPGDAGPADADPFAPLVLGPLDVSDTGSGPIPFAVPGGVASFTVIVEGPFEDDARRLVVLALTAPDGTRVVDWDDPAPDVGPAAIPYPGVTTALVPSSDDPRARPREGTWSLEVGVLETDFVDFTPVPGRVDRITVVFEPAGEEGGALDLVLHLAPGTGLSAAEAAASDAVATLLDTFEAHLLGPAGATLGDVAFVDLPARFDAVASSAEVRALVSTRSRPGPRGLAVNVFLVDDLAFAAGFTGGVPSPPGRFATAASGVVVEWLGDGRRTGILAAHEVGHFLGLRHTTELGRDPDTDDYVVVGEDGLSDTPVCESGTAVDDCPDYRNLMFPLFPLDGLSLSDAQARILAASPLLWE